jgi:hypothetical protein
MPIAIAPNILTVVYTYFVLVQDLEGTLGRRWYCDGR